MAGFNYALGISNNAVDAYKRGLLPRSYFAKYGIPSKLVDEFCEPDEWHHTSGRFFNETNFYDKEYVLATFGVKQSERYEVNTDAVEALAEYKKNLRVSKKETIHKNCDVEWVDWIKKSRFGKLIPVQRQYKNCEVTVKGATAYIKTQDGSNFVKRLESKTFKIKFGD